MPRPAPTVTPAVPASHPRRDDPRREIRKPIRWAWRRRSVPVTVRRWDRRPVAARAASPQGLAVVKLSTKQRGGGLSELLLGQRGQREIGNLEDRLLAVLEDATGVRAVEDTQPGAFT